MNKILVIGIIIALLGNVGYQIIQKQMPENVNPMFILMITYANATLICLVAYLVTKKTSFMQNLRALNWTNYLLGIMIVLLETGFLLSYRYGGKMTLVFPFVTIITMVALAFIGFVFYKETIDFISVMGYIFMIIGILLISVKSGGKI